MSIHNFEDYFTPEGKDSYELLFDVDAYYINHSSGNDNSSIDGGRPLSSTLSTDVLESLGHTINSINNCLQFIIENYEIRKFYTKIRCRSYSKIPLSLPIEILMIIKKY